MCLCSPDPVDVTPASPLTPVQHWHPICRSCLVWTRSGTTPSYHRAPTKTKACEPVLNLRSDPKRRENRGNPLTNIWSHVRDQSWASFVEIFPRTASQPVTCRIVLHGGLIFTTWVIKAGREEKPFSFSDRCQHSSRQVMYLTCLFFWRGGGSCQQIDLFPFMGIQGDVWSNYRWCHFFLDQPYIPYFWKYF